MTYAFIGSTTMGTPTTPATGIPVVNLDGPSPPSLSAYDLMCRSWYGLM